MSKTAAPAARKRRVRIIGGRWKRTPLPVAEVPGLRPTPDRIRETLFNWLGQKLDGKRCLDLFAGTGALSFEAASRGAAQVVCVESNRTAAGEIRRAIARLAAHEIELHTADAHVVLQALMRSATRFDVVFLDPPFHQGWPERVLPQVAQLLADEGAVYLESEAAPDTATLDALGLEIAHAATAGQVHYHLLTRIRRAHGSA